jgi:hypothetical protein
MVSKLNLSAAETEEAPVLPGEEAASILDWVSCPKGACRAAVALLGLK